MIFISKPRNDEHAAEKRYSSVQQLSRQQNQGLLPGGAYADIPSIFLTDRWHSVMAKRRNVAIAEKRVGRVCMRRRISASRPTFTQGQSFDAYANDLGFRLALRWESFNEGWNS